MHDPAASGAHAARFFEDYPVGAVFDLGTTAPLDAARIVEFARRYDPQPFHVDAQAGAASNFGSLIASGWQTGSLAMRLIAERYLSQASSLGSPGIDELLWPNPVRPGDLLSARATVLEAQRSRSKPDRGIVRTLVEVTNQRGETVMSMKAVNLIRCRAD